MASIEGMDAAVVRQVAAKLKAQADALGGIIVTINRLVDHAESVWRGRDAQEFASWWASQHRPRLQSAQEAIRGLGQSASNNADEQDRASSSTNGGATPSHAGSTSPTPPLSGVPPTLATAGNVAIEKSAADWAISQHGNPEWGGRCLSFVYQAYEQAGVPRSKLDSLAGFVPTDATYPIDQWNHWTTTQPPQGQWHNGFDSAPPPGAMIFYSNSKSHDWSHATISLGGGQQISPDEGGVSASESVTTNSLRTMLGWWLPV